MAKSTVKSGKASNGTHTARPVPNHAAKGPRKA